MNGELAELIALATFGTEWLQSSTSQPPQLASNSTFQYVRLVRFVFDSGRRLRHPIEVFDPAAWLQALKRRGVVALRLDVHASSIAGEGDRLPPHVAVAFANGGTSSLVGVKRKGAELWKGAWAVGTVERPPDNRIWDVTYTGIPVSSVPDTRAADLDGSQERLAEVAAEAEQFAREQELDSWADGFRDVLALAESSDPEIPYHPDLLPPEAALPRRRLMTMAVRGWVFGGMGSWNDVWLKDSKAQAQYESVTRRLHAAVLDSLEAATNH